MLNLAESASALLQIYFLRVCGRQHLGSDPARLDPTCLWEGMLAQIRRLKVLVDGLQGIPGNDD